MTAWSWSTAKRPGVQSLGIVGDTNIQNRTDPGAAFAYVLETLRDFDVLVGQWECSLTEAPGIPGIPAISFKPLWRHSHPSMAQALVAAGFDAVSLASNVAYPPDVAAETATHLGRLGIATAGTGPNLEAARKPALIETGGTRIALLSYTSVFWPIEQPATATTPGVATIKAHTAYQPGRRALEMPGAPPVVRTWADEGELAAMSADIERAAAAADLVLVACHWGISSEEGFVAYQQEIARAAIDAGAALVYGTHPHRIQAVEIYRGAPIFYSLGNFAFDWDHMQGRHLDGLLVRCLLDRGRIIGVSAVPVARGHDNNVRLLEPDSAQGQAICSRLVELSRDVGTELEISRRDVQVNLERT